MISVVIPLYNKVNSIESTLLSVLNQSFQDFEVIIVDDGSTDGSAEVIRSIHDSRIRLISKHNGGVSSARNEGIRHAQGEYIAFLDADDLWETDFLKEIDNLINDFPEAGIYGTSYYYLKNGEKIDADKPLPNDFYGIIDNSHWDLAHIYCSTAVCCKRDIMLNYAMFDDRITHGEDLDVWWHIMLQFPAAYSNKPLAVYRFDEDNRAMNNVIPLQRLYIYYFDKYTEFRKQNAAFRHFIDQECMWWLQKYVGKVPKEEINSILKHINFCEYKWTFWLRFKMPRLYNLIKH